MVITATYRKTAAWMAALYILQQSVVVMSGRLEYIMDIRFYDESYYLTQGFFHPVSSWIADYSPLYSLYYKVLAFFQGGCAEWLYYDSWRFWDFMLGLSVFAILRHAGITFIPAMIWAMSACASQLGFPLWPKAGNLAMTGTAVGIALLWKWRGKIVSQLLFTAGLCLCLAWCRPEFLAGAIAAGSAAIYFLVRRKEMPQLLSLIPALAGLGFFLLWGLPAGQSGRGLVAFGQHFVHNWRNITGQNSGDLSWDWVNWRPIFQTHFGQAQNIAEAFVANPADLLQHLWFNLRYFIYNVLVYFSETIFPKRIYGISPLAGLAALWIAAELLSRWEAGNQFIRQLRKQHFAAYLPWLCLALPSMLAGLLFQPRPHYILPLLPFFVFAAGLYLRNIRAGWLLKGWRRSFYFLPIVLFFNLPRSSTFFQVREKSDRSAEITWHESNDYFGPVVTQSLKHKKMLWELEWLKFPAGFRMFDASTGATEYFGDRVVQCGKIGFEMNYPALKNFSRFLDSAKVQGIFLHETIRYDNFFTYNPDWQKIKNQPETIGWYKIAVGKAGDSLLLRKGISVY